MELVPPPFLCSYDSVRSSRKDFHKSLECVCGNFCPFIQKSVVLNERPSLKVFLSKRFLFLFFLDQGGTVKFFLTKRIHPFSLLYTRGHSCPGTEKLLPKLFPQTWKNLELSKMAR